jgi:predicted phosphate transport protein (TIGR00153 family)
LLEREPRAYSLGTADQFNGDPIMAFSLLPKEAHYFALLSQLSSKLKEAAASLVEMLQGADENYESLSKRIKHIEHECDEITHSITTKLNKSFITPFDREDIYTLSMALDDICDYIDAAGRSVVMYNIHERDEHAVKLAIVIEKLAHEIHEATLLLEKSKGMQPHLLEIQRLENEADDIYYRGVAELFKNGSDPVRVIKWKEVYEILENATDRCESVGNIIESIVLKHN